MAEKKSTGYMTIENIISVHSLSLSLSLSFSPYVDLWEDKREYGLGIQNTYTQTPRGRLK